MKSKWESGAVESVQGEFENRSQELNELKKSNVSIKERFKEKSAADDESSKRKSALDDLQIDTSCKFYLSEKIDQNLYSQCQFLYSDSGS